MSTHLSHRNTGTHLHLRPIRTVALALTAVVALLAACGEENGEPRTRRIQGVTPASGEWTDGVDLAKKDGWSGGRAFTVSEAPEAWIPDNSAAGVTRTLRVDRPSQLERVALSVTHPYRGDLRAILVSPAGTQLPLHDRAGGSADNLHIDWNVGEYFGAESAEGTWALHVYDQAAGDFGLIDAWALHLGESDTTDDTDGHDWGSDGWTPSPEPPAADAWHTQLLGDYGNPVVESAHPYQPYRNDSWVIAMPGAQRIRVHFSGLDIRYGDTVRVGPHAYEGNLGDFWSDEIIGDRVFVELEAIRPVWGVYNYGFRIDRIEYTL